MFTKELPEWNALGAKPSQTKLDTGWTTSEKPPADWFNWFQNRAFLAIKELQDNAIHKDGSVAFSAAITTPLLKAGPVNAMDAATKAYVDAEVAKAKKYAP